PRFPYTTLFRSVAEDVAGIEHVGSVTRARPERVERAGVQGFPAGRAGRGRAWTLGVVDEGLSEGGEGVRILLVVHGDPRPQRPVELQERRRRVESGEAGPQREGEGRAAGQEAGLRVVEERLDE